MKKIELKIHYIVIIVIILIIAVLGCVFYWYELRPSRIRSLCAEKAIDTIEEMMNSLEEDEVGHSYVKRFSNEGVISVIGDEYNTAYEICLKKNGLKE